MFRKQVYYVGLRYKHHAQHSGYEGYTRYLGTAVQPPVNFRWTLGKWGWTVNGIMLVATRHAWYSLGALLVEGATLLHMLSHKKCLYHVLYGDSDLWLLRRANQLTGNRLVASFHQPCSHLRKLGIIKQITKNLDAVILVADSQRTYFEEFLPPERIFVIPHGADTNFFVPPEKVSEQPVCIIVGSHLRDFETLKQAINLIWEVNPRVHFIAVGTRNSKKCYFGGLEDKRIQFLEKVTDEELRQAYQTSKVAIFSFEEATANNALLEAMACGLPIVATDVGGIREYVDDKIGILFPPRNPEALATGVLRLLDDPACAVKMAIASRTRALRYDYRIVADQMCQIYSKILRLS